MILSVADRIAIEREACRRSLATFVREAWPVLEPGTPYVHGWHVEAICAHLEAVTRGEISRLLINIPPGPMRHDSEVETLRGRVLLRDIVVGDQVLTHRGRYRTVSAVHEQGVLPILRIATYAGRVTYAAPTHPYLTPRGWVEAGDLRPGDQLAAVCPEEERRGSSGVTPEEARLLGYLVGDGSVTQATPVFTNMDDDTADDFCACAASVGFQTTRRMRGKHWSIRILGGQAVRDYLEAHGLQGRNSYTKRIPLSVRNGSTEAIRNFLGAYWSCDGGFDVRPTGTRGSRFRAYATTVSRELADDLLQMLALVGIEARIREKARTLETAAQPGGVYRHYSVEVQLEEMAGRFAALPGLTERKRALAAQCRLAFPTTLWGDEVVEITASYPARCLCLTVEEDHSFTCSGIAVKNTMKSTLTSVFWPAWEWGPAGMPHIRMIGCSHEADLAVRDARKMRLLVTSDWYQTRWPVRMAADQSEKVNFENAARGFRQACPVGSMTGKRGHRVVWDDPQSAEGANSPAKREEALRIFRETLPTRVVEPKTSAIIVVMQRLHEADVSGEILSGDYGYEHLCLPMEFEADRRCTTSIGWSDPRQHEGDLLFPERFPREVVDRDKAILREYGAAGQFQQRPAPRTGGYFAWEKLEIVGAAPRMLEVVRYWDKAGTKDGGKRTAGVKIGKGVDGLFYVLDVVTGQWAAAEREAVIRQTAELDGLGCTVWIEQEPGSGGKESAENTIQRLAGYVIHAERPSGDKALRAEPYAVQVQAGNVKVLAGAWNQLFIDEHKSFPRGKFKDQIDAAAGGFNKLAAAQPVGALVPSRYR